MIFVELKGLHMGFDIDETIDIANWKNVSKILKAC